MSRVHIPVLAGELIDLTAPARGETAVDCTFGAGGHARLVADRLGPGGTLICIDRDPAAEARFESSRPRWPARPASCAWTTPTVSRCSPTGSAPTWSTSTWASRPCRWTRASAASPTYDALLDMRMDPSQELDARAIVNGWDERQLAQVFRRRRGPQRAADRARDQGRRRRAPFETTAELWMRSRRRCLPPCGAPSAAVTRPSASSRPSDRGERRARVARSRAARRLELLRLDGRLAAISFHSLEDRRGEALPRGQGARLRLPARLPRLRLRARARGGADGPGRGAHRR